MSMDLEGYESLKTYFQAIATAHKKLGTDKFLFGDEGVAVNKGRSWVGNILWLEEPEPAGVTHSNSDNFLKKKKVTLFVGGAPKSTKFSDEQDHFKECEGIVEDIISKFIIDINNFDVIIDASSIRYGLTDREFMLAGTKFNGCRMDFTYTDPSGFTYNEENWNED